VHRSIDVPGESAASFQDHRVIVCPRRETPAHPRSDAPILTQISIRDALTKPWTTDAHFVAYASTEPRRLSTTSIGVVEIKMAAAIFDLDARSEDGAKMLPSPSWRNEIRQKVRDLRDQTGQRPAFYWTRGGARVVLMLPEPIVISSTSDARAWRVRYQTWCAILERGFGLVADRSCDDWSRLFRLPFVYRDGVYSGDELRAQVANGDVAYVPEEIGVWDPKLDPEHEVAIKVAYEGVTRVVAERGTSSRVPHAVDVHAVDPSESVLGRLFSTRGWIRGAGEGKLHVFCAWGERGEGEHQDGSPSSTSILPPREPGGLGLFSCRHESCRDRTTFDALNAFTREEKIEVGMRLKEPELDQMIEVDVVGVRWSGRYFAILHEGHEVRLPQSQIDVLRRSFPLVRGEACRVRVPTWLAAREPLAETRL
jgi:hypothetical protein